MWRWFAYGTKVEKFIKCWKARVSSLKYDTLLSSACNQSTGTEKLGSQIRWVFQRLHLLLASTDTIQASRANFTAYLQSEYLPVQSSFWTWNNRDKIWTCPLARHSRPVDRAIPLGFFQTTQRAVEPRPVPVEYPSNQRPLPSWLRVAAARLRGRINVCSVGAVSMIEPVMT
jgi:hypothetical protein